MHMKLLAIGAHPDDIEIFMYGFLSACKNKGDDIFLLVATDGSLGGENNGDLVLQRKKESEKGLNLLGKPTFLNLPDGCLGNDKSHLDKLRNQLDRIKPDLIVTHSTKDYHSDHIALSRIVKQIASHYIPIIFCDTMMGINFNPNYYVDITKYMENKINAIICHKTQKPDRFIQLAKLMNSYRSAQCNAPMGTFAEAYEYKGTFPFTDIREFLPQSPKVKSFYIKAVNGFL